MYFFLFTFELHFILILNGEWWYFGRCDKGPGRCRPTVSFFILYGLSASVHIESNPSERRELFNSGLPHNLSFSLSVCACKSDTEGISKHFFLRHERDFFLSPAHCYVLVKDKYNVLHFLSKWEVHIHTYNKLQ